MAAALRAVVYTLHYLATWWARPFPTAHNHAAPLFVAAMSTSGRHVLSPPLRRPLCWCRLTRLLHLRVCVPGVVAMTVATAAVWWYGRLRRCVAPRRC